MYYTGCLLGIHGRAGDGVVIVQNKLGMFRIEVTYRLSTVCSSQAYLALDERIQSVWLTYRINI